MIWVSEAYFSKISVPLLKVPKKVHLKLLQIQFLFLIL